MGGTRTARSKRTLNDSDDSDDGINDARHKPNRRATEALSTRRGALASASAREPKAKAAEIEFSPENDREDEPASSINNSPQSNTLTAKLRQTKTQSLSKRKSPAASPTKSKRGSQKPVTDSKTASSRPNKSIYSFFNATTQRQQSQGSVSPQKCASPTPKIEEAGEGEEKEDLIQDDSLDEELATQADNASFAVPHHKRKLDETQVPSSSLLQGSQKFLKTASGRTTSSTRVLPPAPRQADNRPWVDRYGPQNTEELAVHRKKVSDVREWLSAAVEGTDLKRLLLVKGPAGSGKTAAVRTIANQLGLRPREWHNPESLQSVSEGSASITAQFQDFIGSSGKYGTLDLFHAGSTIADSVQDVLPEDHEADQVTIVEELPNAFMRPSSGPSALRSCILQYLAASTPSMDSLFASSRPKSRIAPIVMIFSETLLTSSSASVDSLTAQKLLGPEIINHPGVSIIEFNPVAPTILVKALELIIRKEARASGRRRAPGPAVLKHLSEIGDIRNAVSALEFMCLRGDDANAWSGRVAATTANKGRKGPKNESATLTEIERKSLELVTQRESALGIFHSVGKVVYNKRETPAPTDTPPPALPLHLAHLSRSKAPEADANALLDELGTDIQTFIAVLHENYVLSCSSSDSNKTLDSINGSIDALSDADLLSSDNLGATGLTRHQFRGTGGDALRQEEISYQTATRGLLFSLPYPVKRTAPPPGTSLSTTRALTTGQQFGGRGDAFKMFFPASFKLWRQREEIEGLLTLMLGKSQRGELRSVADLVGNQKTAKAGSVESWRGGGASRFMASGAKPLAKPSSSQPTQQHLLDSEPPSQLLVGGASAKGEMLLEQLPYIALINRRATSSSMQSDLLRQIERVTHMTGLAVPPDDEEEDEEEPTEDLHAAIKAVPLRANRKEADFSAGAAGKAMQGLVLSDDDIEDN